MFLCLGYELSIVYVNPCPILDKGQVLYLVYVSYLGIVYVIASPDPECNLYMYTDKRVVSHLLCT